jgi:hypothetical protein
LALFVQFVIIRIIRFLFKKQEERFSPLLFHCSMVPKGGFEPPRGLPTTPSRWRVYQFHHFGNRSASRKSQFSAAVMQCCSLGVQTAIQQHSKTFLFLRLRCGHLGLNRNVRGLRRSRWGRSLFHQRGDPS